MNGEWQAVPMAAAAILTDFFYENEEDLYPPPAKGGRYFMDYLGQAVRDGWRTADDKLRAERQQKGERVRPSTSTTDADDLFAEIRW